jgi:nickel superoxide dismutase
MNAIHAKRVLSLLILIATASSAAWAHCQIPCGIYDDEARFEAMLEHVETIEKSMKQITSLGGREKPDWNQIVRWVNNKDHHADELSGIATYYFMAQRIKPPAADAADAAKKRYAKELSLLHRIVVRAMKAKQTTELDHVTALRELISEFRKSYQS